MPAGTIAYHWSPEAGAYQLVNSIPAGGADWVYSDDGGAVSLQFAPLSGGTLVIHGLSNLGPYQVHVGDTVTLLVPASLAVSVGAPPSLLRLEASGMSADGKFWTWRAIAPGRAFIELMVTCHPKPPCEVPDGGLEIDILPERV